MVMSRQSLPIGSHCLLCGGPARGPAYPYDTDWNGRRFNFLSCGKCGATYIAPIPSPVDFELMYARSNYHEKFYETAAIEAFQTSLHDFASFLPTSGRMLDFGCGNGAYLLAATRAGFTCDGVELDRNAIQSAAEATGCEVVDFEKLRQLGRTYSVIHLGDVLEHLPDPAAVMRLLRPMLAPEGVFFIEGPLEDNASPVFYASRLAGWLKKRVRPGQSGAFTPYHLTRASARTQRSFFENVLGYRVQLFETHETGWPYMGAEQGGSTMQVARESIAKIAIVAQKLGARAGLQLGNRFTAIVSPRR